MMRLQNNITGFMNQMNNQTSTGPNIDTMRIVVRQLQIQMRQQEIRLDIIQNDKHIRFFLEEDELAMVAKVIEQKIAHLRECCSELMEDCGEYNSTKQLPTQFY